MAEVHFPPQTYSSSFFLNAIPEDDKVGNKVKVKNKEESPTQSSPILDCFMKTFLPGNKRTPKETTNEINEKPCCPPCFSCC